MPKSFYQIESSVICAQIPEWAKLERELFQTLNQSIDIFLNKYTSEDGSLIWDSKFLEEMEEMIFTKRLVIGLYFISWVEEVI